MQAPRVGIRADLRRRPARSGRCARPSGVGQRAPLHAVDRTELARGIRPLVPDRDAVLLQPPDVRLAAQEPQQLVRDRLEVHALRRDEREALREVEADLAAERRSSCRCRCGRPCGCRARARRAAGLRTESGCRSSRWPRYPRAGLARRRCAHRTYHVIRYPFRRKAVRLGGCEPDRRPHRHRHPARGDGRRRRLPAVAPGASAASHPARGRRAAAARGRVPRARPRRCCSSAPRRARAAPACTARSPRSPDRTRA